MSENNSFYSGSDSAGDTVRPDSLFYLSKDYMRAPVRFGEVFLVQIGRRFCKPSEKIDAHLHDKWFELTIVNGGRCEVFSNGESENLKKGDIFLSFPYDLHEMKADKKEGFEYDFISFYPENEVINADFEKIVQKRLGGADRIFHDERIAYLVKTALTEFSDEAPYRQEVITDVLRLVIFFIIRDYENVKERTADVSETEILCYQIMNYLDTHLFSLSKLEELAVKFGYNYRYLSGLFKKTTGKTISDYQRQRKMETAKALVVEKKKKIGEIADMFGYTPYSFSKAFKKEFGVSPKTLQKKS